MCVADLNVSTLECRHRWYHLLRPCSPTTNLDSCSDKLRLEGWENRLNSCPWCDEDITVNLQEFQLIGNDRTPSIGGLSRASSSSTIEQSIMSTRRESRSGSIVRTDSSTSITDAAAEKNRAQNTRIQWYITSQLETINQGETKDQSSSSRRSSLVGSLSPSSTLSETSSILGKSWKRGKKISRGVFR
ncbi:MAG: hypothetical protein M1820_006975 [Bogoriella megaspora]|nr:MAG: hypothetical protein M1820_006975 [Bogoriella megaspora]